ncbi:glycosyltransferase family 4 protein [Pseudomonas sp. EA_105y_Pfl2_R69]|uniref:glycosyltransferase family 4 protein n=1 Tax=Pseudomonas sp. EA_105y_Pfl2_R69 TaxID=3088683 RepID=UPI0030D9BBB8
MNKIAHITTVHSRSDSRIFSKQCATLAAANFGTVALFVADGQGDSESQGVKIFDIGRSEGRLRRFLSGSYKMFKALRGYKADVVHFHDSELIPLGLTLRAFGVKVVYDVHEDLPRDILIKEYIPYFLRRLISSAAEFVEWVGGQFFSGIVTATPVIASRFPSKKTLVVCNFPIQEEFALNCELAYPARPKSFCYVGTISEARGPLELVNAMAIMPSDCRLTLAGSFNTQELECKARSLKGWARVYFLGWVSRKDVSQVLGASRAGMVTLLPTQTHLDSYPIKLFEYMAAGLPVVASDFPLWRDILEGVECAVFVDPANPGEIAKAMKWLLDNPSEAEAMGQAGKRAIEERINWAVEGEKLLAFYRQHLLG